MKWGLHHTGDFADGVWLNQSTQSLPGCFGDILPKS
jgi:hypothetical protein